MKFQGAEAPRGECIGFHGPGVGSVSDSAMMHDSRITCDLDEIARRCSHLLGLCGDPARPRSPVTCKPLMAGARETMAQRIHNHLGARTRVTVEWKFGDLQQRWRCLTERKQLRTLATPVPRRVRAGTFLANCANCHCPNRTESRFNCSPPTLAECLSVMTQPAEGSLQNCHHR